MRLPIPRPRPRSAAAIAAAGFAMVASFQLALAAGAPLGDAAWGGSHSQLPTAQRVASGVAVAFWIAAALVIRASARAAEAGVRSLALRRVSWGLAALTVLGALLNFASQSPWENFVWGPLALVLATLCALVARANPAPGGLPGCDWGAPRSRRPRSNSATRTR